MKNKQGSPASTGDCETQLRSEVLLFGLNELLRRHNGQVTVEEYKKFSEERDVPSVPQIVRVYGNWNDAVKAAGGTPVRVRTRRYCVVDVAEKLFQLQNQLGHRPTPDEIASNRKTFKLPSITWIYNHGRQLQAALDRLGAQAA